MIATDQPTIFGDALVVGVSSSSDETMKFAGSDPKVVVANREQFLAKLGIKLTDTTLVGVTYDTDDFTKYKIVTPADKGLGMTPGTSVGDSDALAVDSPEHALFLLVADCAAVVLYDPEHSVMMLSHVGRHSAEADGARKSAEFMKTHFNGDPSQLLVWIGPAVGKATYPLHNLGGVSLHEAITEQLERAGVVTDHIEASTVDTAHDANYFSHSEHTKKGDTSYPAGRFAVVAMIRP
jgi:copper oxidase (laccase) domain-containing protein